jgi:hypothetical protein
MRLAALIFATAIMTDGALASSFVTIEPPAKSSSILVLGTPAPVVAAPAEPAKTAPAVASASLEPDLARFPPPDAAELGIEVVKVLPDHTEISPSIIALGEPDLTVTYEKVASTTPDAPVVNRFAPPPMVIRGGIAGNATKAPAADENADPQPTEVAEQAPKIVERPRSPDPSRKEPEPQAPAPAPIAPPPPPTRTIE